MKVDMGFEAWANPGRTVVTVGNFDGVHVGHQVILRKVVATAAELGAASVAVTFDPVPKKVLQPDTAPPLIETLEQRLTHFKQLGLENTIVISFNQQFASRSPEDFVLDLLVGILKVKEIVVGENFSFGHEKRGNLNLLKQIGSIYDFGVVGIPEIKIGNQRVSSTLIRQQIKSGQMEEAHRYMGRPFALQGTVVHGEKLGKTIGVPTANFKVENELLPATGVYVTRALLQNSQNIIAATNVGFRPTVGGKTLTVEAHLLHYSGDLYGQKMELQFFHRLREEMRFKDLHELKAKINTDIQQTESYFNGKTS